MPNIHHKTQAMNFNKRIELVRLFAKHLGPDDITDRHVILDRVDKSYLLHAAQGMATELNLDILGAVAIGAMDCRLVYNHHEQCPEYDHHIENGMAVYLDESEYPD